MPESGRHPHHHLGSQEREAKLAKQKANRAKPATPVRLFLDTCVWLDMAGNEGNEPLLGALEALCHQHVINVVAPQIVRDEFARNKDRIIKESGRSLSGALKRVKVAMWKYGDPMKKRKVVEVLDDIDHRLNSAIDVTADAAARIEKLFADSAWRGAPDAAVLAASNRALQKQAPFHNGKNNFADAVIIELYGQMRVGAKIN
jgi:hypothetical protein